MSGLSALEHLKQLVVERTGHHYYVDKDKLLYDRARERMVSRGLASLDQYVQELERVGSDEWRALEDAITVGETYFFRYPDHFAALREDVLPRLIAARRDVRSLRVWSIGCSNGAEPYSVAILLRELLGDEIDGWRISLTGGDISEKALSAARAARFNAWALRTMGSEDRAKYFDRDGSIWVLKRQFRSMVRFERQNILALLSPTPPLEWTAFDLILCRNVLIYFSPAQAVELSTALAKRLAPDGVLFLGHAEATLATDQALWHAMPQAAPAEFVQALQPLSPAQPFIYKPLPLPDPPPLRQVDVLPLAGTSTGEDTIEAVQQLADAGAYEEAGQLCLRLIAREPTSSRLQYYDAILKQVSDDVSGAEAALRRALYLDRGFVLAHYRLGMLLLSNGRAIEARRSLLTAARLAEAAPPAEPLPEGQGVSAGDLGAALRDQLAALGEAA
ncbi:MAG: protein-glutamate O-methyltransferase CheR [Hyphomonadaceae bacterium]|nr:protein-glutamate O-methyltransferase CheR [Hyphomonadaceae bacterium]